MKKQIFILQMYLLSTAQPSILYHTCLNTSSLKNNYHDIGLVRYVFLQDRMKKILICVVSGSDLYMSENPEMGSLWQEDKEFEASQ